MSVAGLCLSSLLYKQFSVGVTFVPQETCGSAWRYCWLSQLGRAWWGDVLLALVCEDQCAAGLPTLSRVTDTTDSSGQMSVALRLRNSVYTLFLCLLFK